jgi:hypothetical protein
MEDGMLIRWLRLQYQEDDGQGGGGGSEDGGKVRASDLRSQLGTTVDEQALMRLLEKHADVLGDNHRLRGQRSALKQQLAEAQGKVPVEGARVLSAEDATAYDAYVALGKPDEIKKTIEVSAGATAELAKLKREKELTKAAEAAGYKSSVLMQLAGDSLDIQTKQGKDGKPAAVVVVDGKETPLTDYAQAQWADFIPALTPKAQPAGAPDINAGARGNGNIPATTTGIVRF